MVLPENFLEGQKELHRQMWEKVKLGLTNKLLYKQHGATVYSLEPNFFLPGDFSDGNNRQFVFSMGMRSF